MKIPGPLSFKLMTYSMAAFVATALMAPLLDAYAAFLAVAGFLMSVAAVTCGIYELKNQPAEKLLSMIGLSICGTVVALTLIFMVIVFVKMDINEPSEERDRFSESSRYR